MKKCVVSIDEFGQFRNIEACCATMDRLFGEIYFHDIVDNKIVAEVCDLGNEHTIFSMRLNFCPHCGTKIVIENAIAEAQP